MDVKIGEFKSKKIFQIWAKGTDDRPFISMGIKKLKVLVDKLEEIKKFIAENE